MKKIFSVFILSLMFFLSCKKNETEPPIVTLFSPVANDSFYVADSVRVIFSVRDKNLDAYKIIISNSYTRKIYYKEETAVDVNDITIDKRILVNINADTTVLLNVLGIDKNGNTGNAGVSFKFKK